MADELGLASQLLSIGANLSMRDATEDATERVEQLRDFIRAWAIGRGLAHTLAG